MILIHTSLNIFIMTLWSHLLVSNLAQHCMIFHPSIHPSESGSVGQQSKQSTDLPLHGHLHELILGNTKAFPKLAKRCNQHVLVLLQGLLPIGHAESTSPKRCPEGILVWLLNDLNFLLSFRRSTDSTLTCTQMVKLYMLYTKRA